MARSQPRTVIFSSCDAVARSVYRAAGAAGVAIPTQLSVIGCDDDSLARHLDAGLTTAHQPFDAMGRSALALLQQVIADPARAAGRHVLPVDIVRRASSANPKR